MRNPRTWIPAVLLIALTAFVLPLQSGEKGKWWRVYFTEPWKSRKEVQGISGPETAMLWLIGHSKKSIWGAFYEISSPEISAALIEAKKRGIDIRLVMETGRADCDSVTKMKEAGIPIVTDDRSGLMHNKFAVFDGAIVWTGSYNLTKNGAYKNNNNAIAIASAELAEIYIREFREMFEEGIFGNRRDPGPFAELRRRYYVKIEDTDINVYFSPEDRIEQIILKRLKKANKSVHFMAFSFTSDPIGETLIELHRKGIKVLGIMEKRGAFTKHSEYTKMKVEDRKSVV